MLLTVKQLELLKIIKSGNTDGSLVDLDELIERASYKPKKDSMHFSVRALVAKGLMEKAGTENRRGRRRVLFKILPLGMHFMANAAPPSLSISVADDELISAIQDVFS